MVLWMISWQDSARMGTVTVNVDSTSGVRTGVRTYKYQIIVKVKSILVLKFVIAG